MSSFKKKPSYKNRPIIIIYYLGAYKNPLSYYILYNESKHNILAYQGKANKKKQPSYIVPREYIYIMLNDFAHPEDVGDIKTNSQTEHGGLLALLPK
jgi:hypothetical protein